MKLLRLEMENLRSYKSASVDFTQGVTLFEGDIGSGKSTLLYAIEFALFGLGEVKAAHMLRHGEEKAGVRLDFEVNGSKYAVGRTIEKKSRGASQGPGWIEENGARRTLAPAEIKPAVLEVLGFNEPADPKSTSVIYRYAVFTPQEEMKFILNQRPEERLQTLRKAFGIEDYKTAKDNAKTAAGAATKRAEYLKGTAEGLDEDEKKLASLEKEGVEIERQRESAASEISQLEKELAEKESALSKLAKEKEKAAGLAAEVPRLEKNLERLRANLKEYAADAGRIKSTLEESIKPKKPEKASAEIAAEAKAKRAELKPMEEKAFASKNKARDLRGLMENKECPTCGQATSGKFEGEARAMEIEALETGEEAARIEKEIDSLSREHEAAFKAEAEFEQALKREKENEANAERLKQIENRISELQGQQSELESELAEKKRALEEKKIVLESFTEKEKQVREARSQAGKAKELAASLGERSKANAERRAELSNEISKKKAAAVELEKRLLQKSWLSDYFAPALDQIEEHILSHLNRDFNALFSKWVNELLENADIDASLDDSFTPTVTQGGFDQDLNALSGGEKTAVALAYRLALNALVKRECKAMQSNLLILDEPTDGFSREQLQRMRAVFEGADASQVIIVSHEKELEAFADKVYRVEKKSGESRVLE